MEEQQKKGVQPQLLFDYNGRDDVVCVLLCGLRVVYTESVYTIRYIQNGSVRQREKKPIGSQRSGRRDSTMFFSPLCSSLYHQHSSSYIVSYIILSFFSTISLSLSLPTSFFIHISLSFLYSSIPHPGCDDVRPRTILILYSDLFPSCRALLWVQDLLQVYIIYIGYTRRRRSCSMLPYGLSSSSSSSTNIYRIFYYSLFFLSLDIESCTFSSRFLFL